jgi:hypothetical protein
MYDEQDKNMLQSSNVLKLESSKMPVHRNWCRWSGKVVKL